MYEDKVLAMTAEAEKMHEWMSRDSAPDNPTIIAERLSIVNVFIARSGAMLAKAKLILIEQQEEFRRGSDKMKAMEMKRAQDYATRNTLYLVDKLERINHDLVHQGNNMRKQLDFLTNELRGLYAPQVSPN